jgi:hypothetical protein
MIRFITLIGMVIAATGCSSRTAKFEPILSDIQSGALAPQANGAVGLPQKFAGATPKNEIFVEKKPDGSLFVLFPTWYGRGADLDGILYCSRALQPPDYYTMDWGPGGKHQHLAVGGCDLLTVHAYKSHWYIVSRRVD